MVGAGVVTLRTVLEWHQGDLEDGQPWGGRGHLVGRGCKLTSPPEGEQVRADAGRDSPREDTSRWGKPRPGLQAWKGKLLQVLWRLLGAGGLARGPGSRGGCPKSRPCGCWRGKPRRLSKGWAGTRGQVGAGHVCTALQAGRWVPGLEGDSPTAMALSLAHLAQS